MTAAAGQILPAVLMVAAVLGLGVPTSLRAGSRLHLPLSTTLGLIPLLGLATLAGATLVIGHLHGLGVWLPAAALVAGLACAWFDRRGLLILVSRVREAWPLHWRRSPLAVGAVAVALPIAFIAGLAPPTRTDEVEYHWPAALQWAQKGSWVDSDFRHVDGFPVMEIIYTVPAAWGAYGAAHWLHLLSLAGLGLVVAGIATSVGVNGSAAVGTAAMAMPVVWDGAWVAYNDTATGAFGLAAVAVALGSRHPFSRSAMTLTAVLCAVAISIKPTGLGAVGVVALLLLARGRQDGVPGSHVARSWAALGVTATGTYALWTLRRWLITGSPTDPAVFVENPSADMLSRMPTTVDKVIAPLMPFVTGVVGSTEPRGGRTAFVVQLLLVPALIHVIWRRGAVLRRFALMAVPAWIHWIVMGVAGLRTRFHIVTWAMLVVAVRIAVEDLADHRPRWRRALEMLWGLCVLAGTLDVSLEMLRAIRDDIIW